ncbi:MAG: response regulator receiver domain [Bryobacteraceae bacterium]|jgi:hypothetical protein
MTPQPDSFRQHCVTGIRQFVQTAVVIDNEAYLKENETAASDEPRRAERAPASVLDPQPDTEVAPKSGDASEKESSASPKDAAPGSPHTLDAKALTDAFHHLEIVCGIYKPDSGDELVSLATKAAQHADIVIVDWFLDTSKTGGKAKDIVKSILRRDTSEHGRLRLIAIYTGEGKLPALADDLFDEMERDETILKGGRFRRGASGVALVRGDAKICFLNKPEAQGGAPGDIVALSDLPERLVQEFAEVTEGLLANFAVTAIAAIRRSAHHIAALFRKELDGAYLAHRSRLDHPDDAKEFATELVTDELGSVISMTGVADECLNASVLGAWVDHVTANNKHEFKDHKGGKKYSLDEVKGLLVRGFEAVRVTLGLGYKSIEGIFFESPQQAWNHSFDFARLAGLKYEPRDRSRFPVKWAPVLTLGTVVKIVRPRDQEGQAARHLASDYFVCVQPLCHSVRLDEKTVRLDGTVGFPFQTATIATPAKPEFNLAIRDEHEKNVDLLVGWKPRDGAIFRFRPDAAQQVVLARRDASGHYVFTDDDGQTFVWLGDIKTDAAQRSASELAKYIHTPGTNEFEWLRLAARQGRIDYDGKVIVVSPTRAAGVE